VALIVINDAAVRAWAAAEGVALGSDATSHERVRALIRGELERLGSEFRRFEQPRDFVLIREDFTIQNGQLTPTLKLKRNEVLARYGGLLEALYAKQTAAQPAA
jgi:long-chain acyl-CoA synthetase